MLIYNCVRCGEELEIADDIVYPVRCPKCGKFYQAGCFRCNIPLPDASYRTAVYGIVPEAMGTREKDCQIALVDNRKEEDKYRKRPNPDTGELEDEYIDPCDLSDDELDGVDVTEAYEEVADKHGKKTVQVVPENTVRVIHRIKTVPQQKTAVVCRECYNPETDQRFWGSPEEIDASDVMTMARAVAESIVEDAKVAVQGKTPAEKKTALRAAKSEGDQIVEEAKPQARAMLEPKETE